MVNILILIDKISKFTKTNVDSGRTPLDVYKLSSIIRESFCCSYSIRKNNNLYFYFNSNQILIKFEGVSLRYLGSDERSQVLLLKRALDKIFEIERKNILRMQKSTPGIFVKKLSSSESILENITDLYNDKIIVINEFEKDNMDLDINYLEDLDNLGDYCYIFPFPQNSRSTIEILRMMNEKYILKYIYLPKIQGIENKILYINFIIDHRENQKKT